MANRRGQNESGIGCAEGVRRLAAARDVVRERPADERCEHDRECPPAR